MPLIDKIEMLVAAVDAGIIDRGAAAELLADMSGGKLTQRGAARALADRDRRRQMQRMIADVGALVDAIEAVQLAKTPEEDAAAKLQLEVECTLQQEASRERVRKRILDNLRSGNGLGGRRLLDELLGPDDEGSAD